MRDTCAVTFFYIVANGASAVRCSYFLKGQSHKKVGEMRVEGDSLGPN
jgi:hypothetical protein